MSCWSIDGPRSNRVDQKSVKAPIHFRNRFSSPQSARAAESSKDLGPGVGIRSPAKLVGLVLNFHNPIHVVADGHYQFLVAEAHCVLRCKRPEQKEKKEYGVEQLIAQWIERCSSNQEIDGSIPRGDQVMKRLKNQKADKKPNGI